MKPVKSKLSEALIAINATRAQGGNYPPKLWEEIREAVSESGLIKTCKVLKIQPTRVAKKLNLTRVYSRGRQNTKSENCKNLVQNTNHGFAVYELSKIHNNQTAAVPLSAFKIDLEIKGTKVAIEVKDQKMDWVIFFKGLHTLGGQYAD